jgi:hypothetical protein
VRILVPILVFVVLAAGGCRSPGNPPHRPVQGEYQDIIRRELDSAGSALATGALVLRYIEGDRIPVTYADVVLRQAANDLRKVAQDVRQMQPPRYAQQAHTRLLLICERDGKALANVGGHVSERVRIRRRIASDADVIDKQLKADLDPS